MLRDYNDGYEQWDIQKMIGTVIKPIKYINKTVIKSLVIEFIQGKIQYSFLSFESNTWEIVEQKFFIEEFNNPQNKYKVDSEKEGYIIFKSEVTTQHVVTEHYEVK